MTAASFLTETPRPGDQEPGSLPSDHAVNQYGWHRRDRSPYVTEGPVALAAGSRPPWHGARRRSDRPGIVLGLARTGWVPRG
jgi:hypothetical protein